jgi:hypothetical protein
MDRYGNRLPAGPSHMGTILMKVPVTNPQERDDSLNGLLNKLN